MSEANNSDSQPAAPAPLRLRHRLPKALPNIANLNAASRVHRAAEPAVDKAQAPPAENATAAPSAEPAKPAVAAAAETAKPRKPLAATTNSELGANPATPVGLLFQASNPSSPAVLSHHASPIVMRNQSVESHLAGHSPSIAAVAATSGLSYKQYANIHGFNSVPMSPATANFGPCTPGPIMPASVYNAKFSNEHIMNIIKHKTLQKLKKIESESLKERRKRYQRESALFQADKSNQARLQLINTNSNSSMSSDGANELTSSASPLAMIDRSKMRMRDLLYYSPKTTKRADRRNSNEIILETVVATEPVAVVADISQSSSSSSLNETRRLSSDHVAKPALPSFSAPQLKIAEDGSLILNEESLIIHRTEVEPVFDSTVIENEQNDNLSYNSYRKFHHTKKWSERETAKFYKALSMIGTDFTMIQRLFANRSRDEIKRKFKREEKLNQALIDKILSKTSQIDLSVFVQSSSEDEEPKTRKAPKPVTGEAAEGEETPAAKKKHDRYNLKRVKRRAFVGSESDEDGEKKTTKKKPARKDFESGEFDPAADSKPKTSMKKPQRAPKGVKKVSFASGGNDDDDGEARGAVAAQEEEESRGFSETINDVIKTVCHGDSMSADTSETPVLTSPDIMVTSAEPPSSPPVPEPALTIELPAAEEQTPAAEPTTRMNEKEEPVVQVEQEDEDEEVIDLIFDVDNDLVQEVNENQAAKPSCKAKEDEEESVILDLDNNTFVVNNNTVIDISADAPGDSQAIQAIELQERQLQQVASSPRRPAPRSSIIITKRPNAPPFSDSSKN